MELTTCYYTTCTVSVQSLYDCRIVYSYSNICRILILKTFNTIFYFNLPFISFSLLLHHSLIPDSSSTELLRYLRPNKRLCNPRKLIAQPIHGQFHDQHRLSSEYIYLGDEKWNVETINIIFIYQHRFAQQIL